LSKPIKFEADNLPTNRDVLRHIFWLSKTSKSSIRGSVIETSRFVTEIWKKINLDVVVEKCVVKKISGLLENYKLHKKSKYAKRNSEYIQFLDNLCDIANPAVVPKTKTLQWFLRDQRSNRCSTISDFSILGSVAYNDSIEIDRMNENLATDGE